jgi:Family of unknown function (DUF5706)
MTRTSLLEKIYSHSFDMIKFGEAKNTVLIAFNGAVIVGMTKVVNDTHNQYFYWYAIFILLMCAISVFVCCSALVAKMKHKTHEVSLPRNDNTLFFATVAHLTHEELLKELSVKYNCTVDNEQYESDLARQAVITSQIASRKFKLFNIAIGITLLGIATPISIFIYKAFFDHDK